jgi:outer membrane immunogenic protein
MHAFKLGMNYRVGAGGQPALATARHDWAGPYLGVQAGYGSGWKRWDEFNTRYDVSGGFAGGQIGINAQSGILVAGVEGEIMWAHLTGDSNFLSTFFTFLVPDLIEADTLTSKINWLAMLTGRVGLALPDRWLVYLKGGVAVAHERHTWFGDTPGHNLDVSVEGTRLHTGAVAGVGVEYAFGASWSARAEYDFLYFPRQQVTTFGLEITPPADTTPTHVNFQLKQAIHLVKFGLNYHFESQPVAVKAKY